jgi:PTS system galactitol-specific IIC component
LNKLQADPDKIRERFGVFGEPLFIGFFLGAIVGLLAGYGISEAFLLAMYMAALMVLMPKMISMYMEGISIISQAAQVFFIKSKMFKNREILIGIDACVLMGYPGVIATGIIIIPIMILLALILPGNKVLPFADLVNLAPWFAFATICSKGNVVRGVIISSVLCVFTLYIATDMAALVTLMGKAVGFSFPEGATTISSLCTGNLFVSYIVSKIFSIFSFLG